MKILNYIILFFPVLVFAQQPKVEQDTTTVEYYYIEGDSVPKKMIELDEVLILNKLNFESKEDKVKYLILKRKLLKSIRMPNWLQTVCWP